MIHFDKRFAATLAVPMLTCSTALATEKEIVRCTGELLGAPTFTVVSDAADDGLVQAYKLMKYPNNPYYGPYAAEVDRRDVLTYGDTFILTLDAGRSGYAHLFFHGDAVVIDVDLFQQPEMATNGALTRYQCVRTDEVAAVRP